jgi:hypothetical protein
MRYARSDNLLAQPAEGAPDYQHYPRPWGMRRLVCACCRTVWPCAAHVANLHDVDVALRAYWREGDYGHASAITSAS